MYSVKTYKEITKHLLNNKESRYSEVENYSAYVYRISYKDKPLHYYGVRYSKNKFSEDLLEDLKQYKSSSSDKLFKNELKLFPENFKFKVVKQFKTEFEALNYEALLHNKLNVASSIHFINKHNEEYFTYKRYSEERTFIDFKGNLVKVNKDTFLDVVEKYEIDRYNIFGKSKNIENKLFINYETFLHYTKEYRFYFHNSKEIIEINSNRLNKEHSLIIDKLFKENCNTFYSYAKERYRCVYNPPKYTIVKRYKNNIEQILISQFDTVKSKVITKWLDLDNLSPTEKSCLLKGFSCKEKYISRKLCKEQYNLINIYWKENNILFSKNVFRKDLTNIFGKNITKLLNGAKYCNGYSLDSELAFNISKVSNKIMSKNLNKSEFTEEYFKPIRLYYYLEGSIISRYFSRQEILNIDNDNACRLFRGEQKKFFGYYVNLKDIINDYTIIKFNFNGNITNVLRKDCRETFGPKYTRAIKNGKYLGKNLKLIFIEEISPIYNKGNEYETKDI